MYTTFVKIILGIATALVAPLYSTKSINPMLSDNVAKGTVYINSVIPSYAGTHGSFEVKRDYGLQVGPEEVLINTEIYDACNEAIGLLVNDDTGLSYKLHHDLPYSVLKNKKDGDFLPLTIHGKKYMLTCRQQNHETFESSLHSLMQGFVTETNVRIGRWTDTDEVLIQNGIIERYEGKECYFGECEKKTLLRHGPHGFKFEIQ